MSGILEAILAELQGIKLVLTTTGAGAGPGVGNGVSAGAVPASQQIVEQTPTTTAATTLTGEGLIDDEAIMALIEPHLQNIAIKAAFQEVLQSMGIPRLPEARPDQYTELFHRFTAIIKQSANPAAGAGALSRSII